VAAGHQPCAGPVGRGVARRVVGGTNARLLRGLPGGQHHARRGVARGGPPDTTPGLSRQALPGDGFRRGVAVGPGRGSDGPGISQAVATRAGLGWIGRNGLLVTRTFGPRVRLATVFTDMPLPVAAPIVASQCGTCRRCVDACPAGATQGNAWKLGTSREALVDVDACRVTAERLMRERVGCDDVVCGVCIVVCPFSRMNGDDDQR
jgi:ferredoxin